ncbi:hypothetical protein GCM10010368_23240 [Streptomyces roseiscleroticus]|uniref:Uncharacterized protein n=1 Tax=Streptomyces roseiscleroticus TaxID=1972 RepID=A0ABN3EE59_9ACTN
MTSATDASGAECTDAAMPAGAVPRAPEWLQERLLTVKVCWLMGSTFTARERSVPVGRGIPKLLLLV